MTTTRTTRCHLVELPLRLALPLPLALPLRLRLGLVHPLLLLARPLWLARQLRLGVNQPVPTLGCSPPGAVVAQAGVWGLATSMNRGKVTLTLTPHHSPHPNTSPPSP